MAHKDRTKEIWLIPKRNSLHQTICLIDGILERNYNGVSWNAQNQNNLGVNLKRWGATNTGKNIAAQSIRTLVASMPQYLGFLYINTNTTPHTICLTDAGIKLHEMHKFDLKKIENLNKGNSDLIKHSEAILLQMEKLQITNPIILKDCENIMVFPFRLTLKILLQLQYLDREEIAYFLFKTKNESEFKLTVQEILNFRKLSQSERIRTIQLFKDTHVGNITLVQASSASYYENLCYATGIIDRFKIKPINSPNQVAAIKLKEGCIDHVRKCLNDTYCDIEPYDFGNNRDLWIEYIGDPNKLYPPVDIAIINNTNNAFLLKLIKDDKIIFIDLYEANTMNHYPMYIGDRYVIEVVETSKGEVISSDTFTPKSNDSFYEINITENYVPAKETAKDIADDILNHSSSKTFYGKTLNYLEVLKKVIDIDKSQDSQLRGAYYEYYFYRLLCLLKEEGIVDDVVWNGAIGKYGLPIPAPGGKTGTADITFTINNTYFVLEVTTIKNKSTQESTEIYSVPDHIRLASKSNMKTIGIFCAPVIHSRVTSVMQSVISKHNTGIVCIIDKVLIDILLSKDKHNILSTLNELSLLTFK